MYQSIKFTRLPWRSITPFGVPVVPEVYSSMNVSSGPISRFSGSASGRPSNSSVKRKAPLYSDTSSFSARSATTSAAPESCTMKFSRSGG